MLIGIPVKPFTVAKQRLEGLLDADERRRLGQAIALRTAHVAAATGARVAIVTAAAGVHSWARHQDIDTIGEGFGGGLDGAARSVAAASPRAWAVLHADVPLLSVPELLAAVSLDGPVIAPAHDGGTNLIKGSGEFAFAYGPGSFTRHLAAAPDAAVMSSPGLSLDLDTPQDLLTARRLEAGSWLTSILAATTGAP